MAENSLTSRNVRLLLALLWTDIDSPASLGLDLQPYERPAKPSESATDRITAEYIAHEAFVRDARKQGASNVQFFTLGNNAATGRSSIDDSLLSSGVASFVKSFEEAFGQRVLFYRSGKKLKGGLVFPPSPKVIGIGDFESSLLSYRRPVSDTVDSPRNVFGDYTYADESTLSKWERNALQNARREAKRGSVKAARWADKDSSRAIAAARLAGSLLLLFNKRVLFGSPVSI